MVRIIMAMNYKSLSLLWLILEIARCQEQEQQQEQQQPQETGKEIGEKADESIGSLYSLVFYSFVSACGTMLIFYCLKLYLEMRNRNRPVVNNGPFGDLRDVCLAQLTSEQRKAIAEVVFPKEKCSTFEENVSVIYDRFYVSFY